MNYFNLTFDVSKMASIDASIIYVLILYILFCICIVFPPTELRSAGITVDDILSGYLGSEDLQFVQYHIRRSSACLVVHSLLPLGFYVVSGYAFEELKLFDIWKLQNTWLAYLTFAVITPLTFAIYAYCCYRNDWDTHPIVRNLKLYQSLVPSNAGTWKSVADSVNNEFRRIDKFATSSNSLIRFIVTNNWIIKVTPYKLQIVHQDDAKIVLRSSDVLLTLNQAESGSHAQFLNLEVTSTNHHIVFAMRVNSLEFNDLKDKLRIPVMNNRNIVVQQTLSDQFVEVFRNVAEQNPKYRLENIEELEPCIGCMLQPANVILRKTCNSPVGQGDSCVACNCRPMWCIDCMAKWFCNRQDQQQPNSWLSGKSPCPTCRAKFCMLDIALLQR